MEATAVVCELSVMTAGRGGKVSGVAPRLGDGWDVGGSAERSACWFLKRRLLRRKVLTVIP